MKKIIYFLCIISLTVASCQKKDASLTDLPVIDLDAQTENVPKAKEVHYVPLETNDSSLIGDIDKLIFRNGSFYIFDKAGMRVLIFDRQGSFRKVIMKKGPGPGEYVLAIDMDVDEGGNIYIADNATQRIVKYKAGDYQDYETIDVKNYFIEFSISEDKSVYIGDSYREGKPEFKLAKLDTENSQLNVLHKNEIEENYLITRFSRHYFFRSGDKLSYYKRFSPVVYSISKGEVLSSYSIQSKNHPSNEVVREWGKDKKKILTDNDSYIRDISAFYEAGDYISLTVARGGIQGSYALYDKKTKKTYNWGIMNRQTPVGVFGVYASDGEYFVSYCTPTEYIVGEILSHNPDMDSRTKESLLKLTEESNPIMILYKY